MAYEYESVVWTPYTPMTWSKFAQMQENMDYLKSQIDGNVAYIQGSPRGIGKGILHLQTTTSVINLPANTLVGIGSNFTPLTESGRLYKFTAYCPRFHVTSQNNAPEGGAGLVRLNKNGVQIAQAVVSAGSSGNANSVTAVSYLAPGTSTTTVYSVQVMAFLAGGGQWWCAGDHPGFICFEDVGPSS